MLINNIEIPNELIDSIKNKRLAVFAGAGVSMGKPALLPDFVELTNKIGKNTGLQYNEKLDLPEKYLGKLQHNGIDVHFKACEILSSKNTVHNYLHELIVKLFPKEDIRIITTNYDLLFEQALNKLNIRDYKNHSYPALPKGSNFSGIVHIHGNVNDSDNIVLTDKDFGEAYITEQYATKFLVKVFQTYDILFIGYSYNDSILNYLTRAITPDENLKRFILVDESDDKYNFLNIQPIVFGKKKFDILNKIIEKLDNIGSRSILELYDILSNYEYDIPKDSYLLEEIKYDVLDKDLVPAIKNRVKGPDWFNWLSNEGVFDNLFSYNQLSDVDIYWCDWIIKNVIDQFDEEFIKLYVIKNQLINDELAEAIVNKLTDDSIKMNHEIFCRYINILDRYLMEINLFLLVNRCIERNLLKLAYNLYKKLFTFNVVLKTDYGGDYKIVNSFKYKLTLVKRVWKRISEFVTREKVNDYINFLITVVEAMHAQVIANNNFDNYCDLSFGYFDSLESINRTDNFKDWKEFIVHSLVKAFSQLKKSDKNFALSIIDRCLTSEFYYLKNVGIKLLRQTNVCSDNTKLRKLLKNVDFYDLFTREQLMLCIKESFNNSNNATQNRVVKEIMSRHHGVLVLTDENRSKLYSFYNWCVWFSNNLLNSNKLCSLKKVYETQFGFKPRQNPHHYFELGEVRIVDDKTNLTNNQLMSFCDSQLIEFISNFKEDRFRDITLEGLYKQIAFCLLDDYNWMKGKIDLLLSTYPTNYELWKTVINQIENSIFTINQKIEFIDRIFNDKNLIRNCDKEIAQVFYYLVNNDEFKQEFNNYSDYLWDKTNIIYENGMKTINKISDVVTTCLNSTVGELLQIWIKLYFSEFDNAKSFKYLDLFEILLNDRSEQRPLIICMLVGHSNLFYQNNYEWFTLNIKKFLSSEFNEDFINAWEGMASFSLSISLEFAEDNKLSFYEAISRIDLLTSDAQIYLVSFYTLTMIHLVREPLKEWVLRLLNCKSKIAVETFYYQLGKYLLKQDEANQEIIWNEWIECFVKSRMKNIPIPINENEFNCLINLIFGLKTKINEFVQLVINNNFGFKIFDSFVFTLDQLKYSDENKISILHLLAYVLSSQNWVGHYLNLIIGKIKESKVNYKDFPVNLQKVLLKYNYDNTNFSDNNAVLN